MGEGGDLGKRFWFCGVGLVAGGTQVEGDGERRFESGGVVGMNGEGAMAGFTADVRVRAFGLGLNDFVVAAGAGLAAGEDGLAGGDLLQSRRAEVAILAEAGRDHRAPDQ